jgi:hypothetical protein
LIEFFTKNLSCFDADGAKGERFIGENVRKLDEEVLAPAMWSKLNESRYQQGLAFGLLISNHTSTRGDRRPRQIGIDEDAYDLLIKRNKSRTMRRNHQ